MQILPDAFTERTDDALSTRLPASPSQSQFSEELRKSFQATNNGSGHDSNDAFNKPADSTPPSDPAAEDYFNAFLAASPYNPNPEAFSPFAPQKVRFTTTEADRLIEAMGQDKISPQALAAMKDMSRLPGGATAEQLLQAAREAIMGKGSKLSKIEEAQLLSLSQKSAGAEGKELKNLFTQGTQQQALENFLAGLGADESITVSKDEMSALIKSLGLSDNTGKTLLAAFGDSNSLTTTGKGMAALLDTARKELDTAAREQEKLLGSLEKRLPSIMRDAEKREEMERMAGMREDRAVAQARTLIQDTATQAAPGRDDVSDPDKQTRTVGKKQAENQTQDETVSKDSVAQQKAAGQAAGQVNSLTNGQNAAEKNAVPTADTTTSQDAVSKTQQTKAQEAKSGQERDERQAQNKKEENAHYDGNSARGEDSRNARPTQPASTQAAQNTLFASVTQGVDTVPLTTSTPMAPSTPAQSFAQSTLSAKTLEQIESAFLSASKNGTQRLEIALTPSDLGSMTVVLTSRHGEITAVLKPDRAETAAMLTQQAEQIRQELEHQGFKVEKVDVQTQLSDHGGQNWQGSDQHNSSRDLAARADEMARMRRLERSSSGRGDLESSLARDMHLHARTASVAGQGLHLIA